MLLNGIITSIRKNTAFSGLLLSVLKANTYSAEYLNTVLPAYAAQNAGMNISLPFHVKVEFVLRV